LSSGNSARKDQCAQLYSPSYSFHSQTVALCVFFWRYLRQNLTDVIKQRWRSATVEQVRISHLTSTYWCRAPATCDDGMDQHERQCKRLLFTAAISRGSCVCYLLVTFNRKSTIDALQSDCPEQPVEELIPCLLQQVIRRVARSTRVHIFRVLYQSQQLLPDCDYTTGSVD
jgi:hypothetical protein